MRAWTGSYYLAPPYWQCCSGNTAGLEARGSRTVRRVAARSFEIGDVVFTVDFIVVLIAAGVVALFLAFGGKYGAG